jgi:hypothetical protein
MDESMGKKRMDQGSWTGGGKLGFVAGHLQAQRQILSQAVIKKLTTETRR